MTRTAEERRIIRVGTHAERTCWAVVGVLRQLLEQVCIEEERPQRGRRTCADCGGLRQDTKAGCDVCRALRTVEQREHLAHEVEWLLGTDSPTRIARRLGYRSTEALAKRLSRDGRRDLATHFYSEGEAA